MVFAFLARSFLEKGFYKERCIIKAAVNAHVEQLPCKYYQSHPRHLTFFILRRVSQRDNHGDVSWVAITPRSLAPYVVKYMVFWVVTAQSDVGKTRQGGSCVVTPCTTVSRNKCRNFNRSALCLGFRANCNSSVSKTQ